MINIERFVILVNLIRGSGQHKDPNYIAPPSLIITGATNNKHQQDPFHLSWIYPESFLDPKLSTYFLFINYWSPIPPKKRAITEAEYIWFDPFVCITGQSAIHLEISFQLNEWSDLPIFCGITDDHSKERRMFTTQDLSNYRTLGTTNRIAHSYNQSVPFSLPWLPHESLTERHQRRNWFILGTVLSAQCSSHPFMWYTEIYLAISSNFESCPCRNVKVK